MKGLAVATFAVGLLACCIGLAHLAQFDAQYMVLHKGRLQTNCVSVSKEMLVINSLILKPDLIAFPGPLKVSFNATVNNDIDAPLKAVVYLCKKVGNVYMKIPCFGIIGSCTYDDLCELLSQITECPLPFQAAGIPCKCPFKKGKYRLPETSFDVESAFFPPGDYHGQANLTMNGSVVGCYDIKVSFT